MSRKHLIGIALGTTILSLAIQSLGVLQLLEWAVLDQWFRLRPLETRDSPVVIISIDEIDIAANGQWPLSDLQLAQLLTILRSHDPAAIGLDLYRDLPIAPGQAELHQVLTTTPNLIGIEKAVGQGSSPAVPPSPALQDLGQVAFNDLVLDGDGHIRRHLLSIRHNGEIKLAIGVKLALIYLEENFQITQETLGNNRIRLGKAEFSPLAPDAGGYVNADIGGYQMMANYLRLQEGMTTISLRDVMNGNIPKGLLAQKVVLIGLKADSSWGDRFYTPYSRSSDEVWSGVEIHANLTAQLIAAALEGRSPLRTLPESLEWGWILLWASLAVACNPALILDWRRLSRLPGIMGLLIVVTYALFVTEYWLPLMTPLLGMGAAWLTTQSYLVWHRLQAEKKILEQSVQERTHELVWQNQQLEQARAEADLANQAKSSFLAHMSHELRTPLTAILGFGDLLRQSSNLPSKEKEYTETIGQSGKHLLRLINNILELSKIESGSIIVQSETIHLPSLLNDIQKMFQAEAIAKQITLTFSLMESVSSVIEVDGGKLRQILINLLGNAVKFTQLGSITLKMQVCSVPASSDHHPVTGPRLTDSSLTDLYSLTQELLAEEQYWLECSVEDTGPGISHDEIEYIFQPFVQTTAGNKLGKGTGLGLPLVRQYVERMGGEIQVSSRLGEGSCFSFYLPIKVLQSFASPSSDTSLKSQKTLTQRSQDYRVLIVEDDPNSRSLITQWLTDAKFEIQAVENGTRAMQVFETWHPNLILLDIHLPDIDGYEVARRMRSQQSSLAQEPSHAWISQHEPVILAVTAGVLQDKRIELLAAGCDDVVWKPIESSILFETILDYI